MTHASAAPIRIRRHRTGVPDTYSVKTDPAIEEREMAEPFSNRQSLTDAATVLAARRAVDREIAHLVADPFDRDAAERLRHAVSANAERAQEALERLVQVSGRQDEWPPAEPTPLSDPGTGSHEAAPQSGPYRLEPASEEHTP